jgi:acyl-CoA synthetase (AMP-forming)/AMP-acid ligase II
MASVILNEPEAVTPEELQKWINERVEAKFQRVSAVVIKEDFPRSAAGKTLKREMRETYWEGRDVKL